ncbi:hypothetical protein [Fulvimarina sp. MAC8]|uniref:hypothetical protein n=1 Tax=Fulvimarina sp. MAC8 TaxID=3162874 RepID=UPI0032EC288E
MTNRLLPLLVAAFAGFSAPAAMASPCVIEVNLISPTAPIGKHATAKADPTHVQLTVEPRRGSGRTIYKPVSDNNGAPGSGAYRQVVFHVAGKPVCSRSDIYSISAICDSSTWKDADGSAGGFSDSQSAQLRFSTWSLTRATANTQLCAQ